MSNKHELIFQLGEAKKSIKIIRDTHHENRDLESKIKLNLKKNTALVIRISKSLSITTDKVRECVSDHSGKTFDTITDEIVLKVADTISKNKIFRH